MPLAIQSIVLLCNISRKSFSPFRLSCLHQRGTWPRSTRCLKKVPTFKLSLTLSNLNRCSKFCTAGKRMKFARKRKNRLRFFFKVAESLKVGNFFEKQCSQLMNIPRERRIASEFTEILLDYGLNYLNNTISLLRVVKNSTCFVVVSRYRKGC